MCICVICIYVFSMVRLVLGDADLCIYYLKKKKKITAFSSFYDPDFLS